MDGRIDAIGREGVDAIEDRWEGKWGIDATDARGVSGYQDGAAGVDVTNEARARCSLVKSVADVACSSLK